MRSETSYAGPRRARRYAGRTGGENAPPEDAGLPDVGSLQTGLGALLGDPAHQVVGRVEEAVDAVGEAGLLLAREARRDRADASGKSHRGRSGARTKRQKIGVRRVGPGQGRGTERGKEGWDRARGGKGEGVGEGEGKRKHKRKCAAGGRGGVGGRTGAWGGSGAWRSGRGRKGTHLSQHMLVISWMRPCMRAWACSVSMNCSSSFCRRRTRANGARAGAIERK